MGQSTLYIRRTVLLLIKPYVVFYPKLPERYEKCLRVSPSIKEELINSPSGGREWAMSLTAKDSPFTKWNSGQLFVDMKIWKGNGELQHHYFS